MSLEGQVPIGFCNLVKLEELKIFRNQLVNGPLAHLIRQYLRMSANLDPNACIQSYLASLKAGIIPDHSAS